MNFYDKHFLKYWIWFVFWWALFSLLQKFIPKYYEYFYSIPFVILIIVSFGSLPYLWERIKNGFDGEDGEWAVEDELKKLPPGFIYIYNLENDRGNIDFAVVCPKGVFAIEVKSGRFNEQYFEKYLNQAKAEAMKVREILQGELKVDLFVEPLLMYSNKRAYLKFGFNPQKGVYVINLQWLQKFFNEYQTTKELDQQTINSIVDVLNKYKK